MHYKKAFAIPGTIVPGPNKPGEIDSFLFPSLYHVAALQHKGLKIFDSSLNTIICASPLNIFSTADSPGSAAMSGMVGHMGKYGCHLHCEMPSQHCKGDSHYFPTMNLPHKYSIARSCHPDVTFPNLTKYRCDLPWKYEANIQFLLGATTKRNFAACHLAVGLCKQTLFGGLPKQPLPVPNIFMMDLMHLSVLNNPDLFVKLFTEKLDCCLIISPLGTGLSSTRIRICGMCMGSLSPNASPTCPPVSVEHQEIPRRRSTQASRCGSISNTSMG